MKIIRIILEGYRKLFMLRCAWKGMWVNMKANRFTVHYTRGERFFAPTIKWPNYLIFGLVLRHITSNKNNRSI